MGDRDKLFLPLGEEPVLAHVVRAIGGAGAKEIWIVTRPGSRDRIVERSSAIERMSEPLRLHVIENPRADEGMGTSIAHAARLVSHGIAAMLLAQGDQPLVPEEVHRALVDRFFRTRPPFVASRYGGLVTTPVVFRADLLPELERLDGDRGARSVLERHADDGVTLDFQEETGLDVDDPNDYRRVQEILRRRRGAR